MNFKRNLITREMVVKANKAMVDQQSANIAGLPLRVVKVISETKISREEMNSAYAKARRTVETHV